MVAFYIDDGLVTIRDLVWLQSSFDILVCLFECIGLFTNAAKTKVMACTTGRIRECYSMRRTHYTNLGWRQPPTESAAGWNVRVVVSACKLDPSRVI